MGSICHSCSDDPSTPGCTTLLPTTDHGADTLLTAVVTVSQALFLPASLGEVNMASLLL